MKTQLSAYFEKIKFLPGNNRSLLLLDLPPNYFMDIKKVDLALSNESFGIIKSIIGREELIQITDRDNPDAEINDQLTQISRNADLILDERGGKDLYVGWPFVRGKLKDGTLVRSPFVFFPFSLKYDQGVWYLEKRTDVNTTLNKTFLLRYAYHNQEKISESLIEKVLNSFNSDSTLFRSELYALLKDSELEIEFNQRNFIDELRSFKSFTKDDLEENEETGKLRLYPYATLGIFPQAGAYLIQDYEKLLETSGEEEKSKPRKVNYSELAGEVKYQDMYNPFRMDGYQEGVFRHVKVGNSVCVQGPPGSGKSQLISNIISDFLANGKRVLMVSQKATALNKVAKQLQSLQLHGFLGLVQDFKNDREHVYQQIIRQIESLSEYQQMNTAVDEESLQKEFMQNGSSIASIIDKLNEFKEALFDESECGKSIKELYLLSEENEPFVSLNQVYRDYPFDVVERFQEQLAQYMAFRRRFDSGDHFWAMGPRLSHAKEIDAKQFKSILDEVYQLEAHIKSESKKFTKREIDFETALFFRDNREPLEQLADNLKNETTYNFYIHMVDNPPDQDIGWLSQKERNLLQCFKGAGPEVSLKADELGRFQEALEHAIKARKGIISWIKWRLYSEDKIFITRVLVANDLKSNRSGFETLLERIDNRLNFEHLISELQETSWLKDFPDSYRKIDVQNWFFYQKLAFKSFHLRYTVRTLPNYLIAKNETLGNYTDSIHKLVELIDQLPGYFEKWKEYINEAQVRFLLLGKVDRATIEQQLDEDLGDILAYHEIRESFTNEQQKLIDDLNDLESEGNGEVEKLFISSISHAWIDHIEQKYPILKVASSQGIEDYMEELQSALDEKLRLAGSLVPLKIRAKAISSTKNDSGGTYEELVDQLKDPTKKDPIRTVISQYEEEIFSLIPCWITTPETASAIFPMRSIFDLVIFDEASQCLSERGIPALLRSANCLVFGDDKQLSNATIYGDESAQISEQVETVYDFACSQYERHSLRRHYNARDLQLIAFSNKHFYEDSLRSIPDFHLNTDHGLELNSLVGKWSHEGNREEADAVVKILQKLLKKKGKESIGVIVFHEIQRVLIMDLLVEKQIQLPEDFFVKIIENSQGEVRDQVIISIGYDRWDLLKHHSSGTVNVMSTRAVTKMYILTSLDLEGRPENTAGKILQEYLQFTHNPIDWNTGAAESRDSLGTFIKSQTPHKDLFEKSLPFADGAVYERNAYRGVMLTDDQLKDQPVIDALYNNYNLLREKQWPFIQFFTREFWAERKASFEKLDRFIARQSGE